MCLNVIVPVTEKFLAWVTATANTCLLTKWLEIRNLSFSAHSWNASGGLETVWARFFKKIGPGGRMAGGANDRGLLTKWFEIRNLSFSAHSWTTSVGLQTVWARFFKKIGPGGRMAMGVGMTLTPMFVNQMTWNSKLKLFCTLVNHFWGFGNSLSKIFQKNWPRGANGHVC